MNTCDQSKQGLETQIASETHNNPESEVTDGCESSKNVPDDIEKDVTDVTGPKEVMCGSEHSPNEFAHKNIDMNAIDQSKKDQKQRLVQITQMDQNQKVQMVAMLELMLFLH
jgi:hypothetical protein